MRDLHEVYINGRPWPNVMIEDMLAMFDFSIAVLICLVPSQFNPSELLPLLVYMPTYTYFPSKASCGHHFFI